MSTFDTEKFGQLIISTVAATIESTGGPAFAQTKEPEVAEREIIEYESRMRLNALEKFNEPCCTACVNFYRSKKDMDENRSIGAIILFLDEYHSVKFLQALGYKDARDGEDEAVLDYWAEVANKAATHFKSELSKIGYSDLEMSAPITHMDDIPDGIEFDYSQFKYCEVAFEYAKEKTLVVAVTMAPA